MVHIIPCRSAACIDLDCFQQLPCVRYFSVPSVCLEDCWRNLLSSIAVILYCWYNADWQVVLIFSSSFFVQGKKQNKKRNKLNRDTDKQVYLCTCRAVETLTSRSKRLIGMTVWTWRGVGHERVQLWAGTQAVVVTGRTLWLDEREAWG